MSATDAQLVLAAAIGRLADVEDLLAAGADVNLQTPSGATPLYIAARQGRAVICEVLLEAGAQVLTSMQDGSTPLFIAAWHGHLDVVCALLQGRAEVSQATVTGAGPLFAAAMSGHVEVARKLIQHGARVDQATLEGATPLMAAAATGREEVVRNLLLRDADAGQHRGDGETALSVAAQKGHEEVTQILRSALVSRSLPTVAAAAGLRSWHPPPRLDWTAVQVAERRVFVEFARVAQASGSGNCSSTVAKMVPTANWHDRGSPCGLVAMSVPTERTSVSSSEASPRAAQTAESYLRRADDLLEEEPLAAYYCRIYGAGLMLADMKRRGWNVEAERKLCTTLTQAEEGQSEALELGQGRGRERFEAFVLASLHDIGDIGDNTECGSGATAARLYNALLLIDVLEWFHGGTLPSEWRLVATKARCLGRSLSRTSPQACSQQLHSIDVDVNGSSAA